MAAILIAVIVVLVVIIVGAGAWWVLRRKHAAAPKGICHVTANVNAVQTPLEFLDPAGGADYNKAMSMLYETLYYGRGLGGEDLSSALGADVIGRMRAAVVKNAPVAEGRFDELAARTVSSILKDEYMANARLYSMADRVAKGTSAAPRPSPVAGWTPPAGLSLSGWTDIWLKFMDAGASQSEEFPGKPLSEAAATKLGGKYPKITPEDLNIFGELEYVYLLVCDAIAMKAFIEADKVSEGGLTRYLARNTREKRENEIADLVVSTAMQNSSMSLQEVSGELLRKIKARLFAKGLSNKILVQISRDWNDNRGQNSAVILNRQVFAYAPGLEMYFDELEKRLGKVDGVAGGDVCISGGYVNKRLVVVVSFHGDSDGNSAGKFVSALFTDEYIIKEAPLVVLGIDANTSAKSLSGFRELVEKTDESIRDAFQKTESGTLAPSLWGSFVETGGFPTTGSARTPMQAQFHKAAKQDPKELLEGKYVIGKKDPKDFILLSFPAVSLGTVLPVSVSIRNGSQFVPADPELPKLLMPNQGLPTDHAMVKACFSPKIGLA